MYTFTSPIFREKKNKKKCFLFKMKKLVNFTIAHFNSIIHTLTLAVLIQCLQLRLVSRGVSNHPQVCGQQHSSNCSPKEKATTPKCKWGEDQPKRPNNLNRYVWCNCVLVSYIFVYYLCAVRKIGDTLDICSFLNDKLHVAITVEGCNHHKTTFFGVCGLMVIA